MIVLAKPLNDFGASMLKLTSRFVLQVLPYLLIALAAAVLLPGVALSLTGTAPRAAASSPPHEIEMMIEPFGHGETTLDLIHQDHEAFAPSRFAKATEVNLEDR